MALTTDAGIWSADAQVLLVPLPQPPDVVPGLCPDRVHVRALSTCHAQDLPAV